MISCDDWSQSSMFLVVSPRVNSAVFITWSSVWLQPVLFNLKASAAPFCSGLDLCLCKMSVHSPGAWTAGSEDEIMQPLVVEVRGRVNVLCSMKMEVWRSGGVFWADGWNTKRLFMQHSESANPPLHKSAYGATGLRKTVDKCQCYGETSWKIHSLSACNKTIIHPCSDLLH